MNRFTHLRFVAAAAVIVAAAGLMGCKGIASKFAGRKESESAAWLAGPALGSPAKPVSDRNEFPALETPEGVAYHTSRSTTAPMRQANPQVTCPVDGNALGNSGTPATVTLQGEPIFVCGSACAKKAQKDPGKFLAKVHRETAARN